MTPTRRQIALALIGAPLATVPWLAPARAAPGAWPDVDTLGINTHIGQGENPQRVAAALRYLGVRHIRDGVPREANLDKFLHVLRGGARLTAVVVPRRPLADTLGVLEELERARPGSLAAVEGPNEINNFPIAYNGMSGWAAGNAFQNDLFRAVRASPILRRVPVIALTSGEVVADNQSDFLNFHPYPQNGMPLTQRLQSILERVRRSSSPGKPIQFTEFGYNTVDVSEQQQADLLLAGWKMAIAAGIRRVFIYQLSDFYRDRDVGLPRRGAHFGLFDIGYRPKLAAKAVAQAARG